MNNTKTKKRIVRRVKIENIYVILSSILNLIAIYKHIQLNGFYSNLLLEFIIYFGFTFTIRYVIKYYRLNPKELINWLIDND